MIFCTFTLLSLTLSIKNKIEFNMFASSTWIGMQLFTVLSYGDNRDYWGICNFSYKNIEKDESAFRVGLKMGIKNFSLSFTNKAKDVNLVRNLIGDDTNLISKIESIKHINLPTSCFTVYYIYLV